MTAAIVAGVYFVIRFVIGSVLEKPYRKLDGRICIEKINGPFLFEDKGTPAEYSAGLKVAIDRGWLELHESCTYVRMLPAATTYSPKVERPISHSS
ncbi:hypothetical protein H8A99_07180 [Bradyrhizobium sp. Arg68]|uniref:hypothetical protein n=1 Tax=Bradyrhizobium ivorense TaxID=2511166 RepID=UPI001E4C6012|nr:hypothetical protein [Bradyrhizobium ivorense]MCC8936283.1 hypothetical protein [Bradyrhizobium ivorense]